MELNVIASGTNIRGDITVKGSLRVEGQFEGLLHGKPAKIVIGKTGEIISDIYADEVVIGGRVTGNVYADKTVKLLKTGCLEGNIYTGSFSAEEGGVFRGVCSLVKK